MAKKRAAPSTAWKPGQSGNPSGRPKLLEQVRDLARTHTEDAIKTLADLMNDPTERGVVRVAAAEALLDRAWGRPTQAVEASGPGGGPLQLAGVLILPPEEPTPAEKALQRDEEPAAEAVLDVKVVRATPALPPAPVAAKALKAKKGGGK